MTCAFTHALIRPSPGGTPGQNRSMSAPQALAITMASAAFAAGAASSSTTPSAKPVRFAIVASPRSQDGPQAAGGPQLAATRGPSPGQASARPLDRGTRTRHGPRQFGAAAARARARILLVPAHRLDLRQDVLVALLLPADDVVGRRVEVGDRVPGRLD